jgi:hypothetical protein
MAGQKQKRGSTVVNPDTVGLPYEELALYSWSARWIWAPGEYDARFAVAYFRREFEVDDPAAAELVLHVSADSRYCLAVNGEFFGRGPARSNLDHYNFETYDVCSRLRRGRNVLAVQVLFYGLHGPVAEMHSPDVALIVQGTLKTPRGSINLDTGPQWQALADTAYSPRHCEPIGFQGSDPTKPGCFMVNPLERLDGSKFPWGWQDVGYDASSWPAAEFASGPGRGRYMQFPNDRWRLMPRQIEHLREEQVYAADVLAGPRCDEMRRLIQPGGGPALTIPANSSAEWTIYMGKLLTGYPAVTVSGGRGSEVELAYAEALSENGIKGQRDDLAYGRVEGEDVASDLFLPGGQEEVFQPFSNYRCARFIRIRIRTGDQPLILKDLRFFFCCYPFEERGRFDSNDPDLKRIWDIAWHTALCCAHEHYEDCPYYEQMQYVSDTRLQMLISYYAAGADSLARAGIRTFDRSRLFDGLTQSRFPSNIEQIIPPFSLFYILMIEDHYLHYGDRAFLAELAPGIHSVLRWFDRHMTSDGLLGRLPWWVFVDWSPQWCCDETKPGGYPDEARHGPATQLTLLLVAALDSAARLLPALGEKGHAAVYARRAAAIRRAVRRTMWSPAEGLYVDGPGSQNVSQHSNLWAILTDTATPAQTRLIMKRLLDDPKLVRTTYIHEYYLFQTLVKIGAWDLLDRCVDRWRDLLRHGFSTFPETPEPTRSDCHAWSAWPMFEFQRVLLGIRPAAPGFASAIIAPKPFGRVTEAAGAVPTCRGEIAVAWKMAGDKFALKASLPRGLAARIELPDGRVKKVARGGKVTFGDAALARTVTLKTGIVRK